MATIPQLNKPEYNRLSKLTDGDDRPALQFPLNDAEYGETQHSLTFNVMKYGRGNRKTASTSTAVARIRLPVPGNLQTSYQVNHGDVEIGAAAAWLADLGAVVDIGDTGVTTDIDFVKGFKGASAEAARLVNSIVQASGEATGIRAAEAARLSIGMVVNPHLASIFEGVGFRNHSFSYDFIAKTPDESSVIREIIYIMKYAMHPDLVHGGNTFTFPFEWKLKFSPEIRPWLYDFTTCVLTSFNVSYNGQGIPTFFENTKAPVNIKLDFTFKETEIITREKIENEYHVQGLLTDEYAIKDAINTTEDPDVI